MAHGRTWLGRLSDRKAWRFTAGQARFLILWYAYDPQRGRWLYRSGVKRGAKGTGKDPFGGALCDIELVGRSQLVFDEDTESWTGQRHMLPLVQIASNSEAQSKDTLRIANAMFNHEAREYFGIDCGETRTILKDGGRLEVLTASERTSEGDPATFILLNESHHMTESSGGHKLAAVARRNVGKSPATLQARICEMTNAHQSGGDAVAERRSRRGRRRCRGARSVGTSCTTASRRIRRRICTTTRLGCEPCRRLMRTLRGRTSSGCRTRSSTLARRWRIRSVTT